MVSFKHNFYCHSIEHCKSIWMKTKLTLVQIGYNYVRILLIFLHSNAYYYIKTIVSIFKSTINHSNSVRQTNCSNLKFTSSDFQIRLFLSKHKPMCSKNNKAFEHFIHSSVIKSIRAIWIKLSTYLNGYQQLYYVLTFFWHKNKILSQKIFWDWF